MSLASMIHDLIFGVTPTKEVLPIRRKGMAELHPELIDRIHIASLSSDAEVALNAYGYIEALADHESYVWVRKAIKVLGDNVAPLPLQIKQEDTVLENHPLSLLLQTANPSMSSADLWRQWVIDMMLGGEEGWELVGMVSTPSSSAVKLVAVWNRMMAIRPGTML